MWLSTESTSSSAAPNVPTLCKTRSTKCDLKLISLREIDFVAIHDAARPCIDDTLVEDVFSAAIKHNIAVPTVPVHSTLKRSSDGQFVDQTVDRSNLYLSQTPQVFSKQQGHAVAMVSGSRLNIKITTRDDLRLAAAFLKAMPSPKFDAPIHPFKDDHLWR